MSLIEGYRKNVRDITVPNRFLCEILTSFGQLLKNSDKSPKFKGDRGPVCAKLPILQGALCRLSG
jgi:hypothetical protein